MALDGEGETTLASGALLSPSFELGLRHDGGDDSSGLGVEIGGGAEYAAGRLRLAGDVRALAANAGYDEWGVGLAARYAPAAGGRGWSFRLAPSWGETQSGVERLWERGAPEPGAETRAPAATARLETELGYGLASPFGPGLLQLTAGSLLTEGGGVSAGLTGAVALGAARLGLEIEVFHSETEAAERRAMVRGELRF